MSAPGVVVEKLTETEPSKEPLLGVMVGDAALTMNGVDATISLSSKFAFVATAFTTTFVVLRMKLPL